MSIKTLGIPKFSDLPLQLIRHEGSEIRHIFDDLFHSDIRRIMMSINLAQ